MKNPKVALHTSDADNHYQSFYRRDVYAPENDSNPNVKRFRAILVVKLHFESYTLSFTKCLLQSLKFPRSAPHLEI